MTLTETDRPTPVRPLARKGAVVDLVFRVGIVVVATGAIVLEVPVWARAPLAVAAAALTIMSFLSRYGGRARRFDGVIRAAGAAVVLLAVLGLVLNVVPGGLTTAGWGIGVGVIEAAALVALAAWRAPVASGAEGDSDTDTSTRARRRIPLGAGAWALAVGGVLAGALVLSTVSFDDTHIAPLALGAERTGDTVEVTVSSGTEAGPYELQLVSETGTTVRYAYGIYVGPDSPRTFVFELSDDSRDTVRLVTTGSTTAIRELTFDTTTDAAGTE